MKTALLVIFICLGILGAGYRWGETATNNAWAVKDAARVKREQTAADAETRRSKQASADLQAALAEQRTTNDQLQGAFDAYKRKHPLVVRVPQPALGRQAPAVADNAPAVRSEPLPVGDDPALTLGAVWMWNSALAGRDVPAGACGLADPSSPACAAPAGVTLTGAWDNQALNARRCAEDRLQHQRLIDFIQGKKQ